MNHRAQVTPVAALAIVVSIGQMSADVDDSWWTQVQERIADSEYEISWQDTTTLPDLERAWYAPNRAQDLRTYFTPEGIRVVRRTAIEPDWEWSLTWIGYGPLTTLGPATSGSDTSDGQSCEPSEIRITLEEPVVSNPFGLRADVVG